MMAVAPPALAFGVAEGVGGGFFPGRCLTRREAEAVARRLGRRGLGVDCGRQSVEGSDRGLGLSCPPGAGLVSGRTVPAAGVAVIGFELALEAQVVIADLDQIALP